jgi:hypothetical protein
VSSARPPRSGSKPCIGAAVEEASPARCGDAEEANERRKTPSRRRRDVFEYCARGGSETAETRAPGHSNAENAYASLETARDMRAPARHARHHDIARSKVVYSTKTHFFFSRFFFPFETVHVCNREDDPDYGYDWEPYYG